MNYLEDYYKCFLYLAEISKIDQMSNELGKAGFYDNKTWEKYLAHFYQFSNLQSQYFGIKTAIEGFITNYISVCPDFGQFLIKWFSMSPQ